LPAKKMDTRAKNLPVHFHEIVEELVEHDGLNYVPRERTTDGRVFEHAADSRVLIDHLLGLAGADGKVPASDTLPFYIRLTTEPVKMAGKDGKSSEVLADKQGEETRLDAKTMKELGIKDGNVLMQLNKAFLELTMKSNGKADLYFHAYFWDKYLKQLQEACDKTDTKNADLGDIDLYGEGSAARYPFVTRLQGLSTTLSKVITNVRKFPFTRASYDKYVAEFANRSSLKKQSQLEQIQRALFVAQIADDQDALHLIEKLLVQLMGYCDLTIRD
jgi:hypothetical protein